LEGIEMTDNKNRDLELLKRLLILMLIKLGATPDELAIALEVHPSRISQLFPIRKISRLKLASETSK